jgi:sirohydrochlorin ferrochelatase
VADDLDGTIVTYLFDLDGDGVYELDSDGISKVPVTFPKRGPHTIGVQVLDDSGAAAIATKTIAVTRAIKKPNTRPPLVSFTLSRPSFGGRAGKSLVIRYRLREKARVEVKLRRRGKLVRVIGRGVRKAKRTYRIVLRPTHLRRGVYTVRIAVDSASGKKQVEQRTSRRR